MCASKHTQTGQRARSCDLWLAEQEVPFRSGSERNRLAICKFARICKLRENLCSLWGPKPSKKLTLVRSCDRNMLQAWPNAVPLLTRPSWPSRQAPWRWSSLRSGRILVLFVIIFIGIHNIHKSVSLWLFWLFSEELLREERESKSIRT